MVVARPNFPDVMGDRFTVLVVENELIAQETISATLREAASDGLFRVVNDGWEAIDYFDGHAQYEDRRKYPLPTHVLLGLRPSSPDGFALLEHLQAHPPERTTPVFVLSPSVAAGEVERACRLGAFCYRVRPVSRAALVHEVRLLQFFWRMARFPSLRDGGTTDLGAHI